MRKRIFAASNTFGTMHERQLTEIMAVKKTQFQKVIIVGAGQNGMVIENIISLSKKNKVVGFLDDKIKNGRVLGTVREFGSWQKSGCSFFVAIGNITFRTEAFNLLHSAGVKFINAIHPSAVIEKSSTIGENVMIGALSYVNVGAKIGDNTLVNNACVIEHDVIIGNNCDINPGVVTGGGASIGDNAIVGLNASIRDHVSVGSGATVGMGSVIVKNVEPNTTVFNRLATEEKHLPYKK